VAFGGEPIATDGRDERRKTITIKHNQPEGHCIIFRNVFLLSRVLGVLQNVGYPLLAEETAALRPFSITSDTEICRRRVIVPTSSTTYSDGAYCLWL